MSWRSARQVTGDGGSGLKRILRAFGAEPLLPRVEVLLSMLGICQERIAVHAPEMLGKMVVHQRPIIEVQEMCPIACLI